MSRLYLLFAAALAAFALVASSSAMSVPKLSGRVGPGFTISLKDAKGKTVKTLKAGKYTFVIQDKSSIHDFNLVGPGVNKTSGVGFIGTKRFTVTLKKGAYKYQCAVHLFKGTFKVV